MNASDIQREKPNCVMKVRDSKDYNWTVIAYYPLTDEGLETFEDARKQDDILEVYVALNDEGNMLRSGANLSYFDHYGKILLPAKDIKYFHEI